MFDIGQQIKYLRKQSGFTQVQLAKKLNKSKSAVCRYLEFPTLFGNYI